MKSPDDFYNHGSVTPKQMMLVRVIAGVLGFVFVALVLSQLFTGELRYARTEAWGRGIRPERTASVTVSSPAGLLFAFLSFGMMGLGSLLFALKPRFFANQTVVVSWILVIVSSFVLLTLTK